ncbi:MAG TPA: efflux transporter outer membrane subunit [Micropepsaceae bacterium]|nr:efflux transporter outer membrane subunit [Micropepsaceae bacterium]
MALLALPLSACAVGPDFHKPAPPPVTTYQPVPPNTTSATPNVAGGDAQTFAEGKDLVGDWWTLFHSQPLDDLIQKALANNHDLKAAQAALKVAHESALAHRGVFLPSVQAGFSANHQQQPGSLAPVPNTNVFQYDLFTPQLSISYTPDVFGLNRRSQESLNAQAQAARYQMLATYTTLTANVVVTVIQAAALQSQIDATHQLIETDTNIVKILQYQLDKGYASRVDLAAQQAQLAQTTATLPPLLKQQAQLRDLLATLAGLYPSQAPAASFDLTTLQLPTDLPLSLPSQLVEQRPDVLQAEANLHSASAQVGVAAANRLPNFLLTADIGSTALQIGQVFASGTGFFGLGAALTAPIFEGGMLKHQELAAKAAYEETAEQYRSTVLNALQNVADTLAALQQDADGLKASAAAETASKTSLDLAQKQVEDGYSGYLSLLNAQQSYQQTRIALLQAEANRFADTAALYQALGGGWWHHPELAENKDAH